MSTVWISVPKRLLILLFVGFFSVGGFADVGPNWIEQWGIRWTFDKNISLDGTPGTYRYGTFVNGDYWVFGPVNIIDINPPTHETLEGEEDNYDQIFTTGTIVNGSMLNPRATANGKYQGYFNNSREQIPYSASLNVAVGVSAETPLTVANNSSLVSTLTCLSLHSGLTQTKSAAVLTVLPSTAFDNLPEGIEPEDCFRPGYCDLAKTLYTTNGLTTRAAGILQSLAPVANMPSLATVTEMFRRPVILHLPGYEGHQIFPLDALTPDLSSYGREFQRDMGIAALMLNLDEKVIGEKTDLMINLIQIGIDLGHVILDGGRAHYYADGGHNGGRRLPIWFAALLLNDDNLKSILLKSGDYLYSQKLDSNGNPIPDKFYGPGGGWDYPYKEPVNPPDYVSFGEEQFFYITQLEVDLSNSIYWKTAADIEKLKYTEADIGLPDWAIRHSIRPQVTNKSYSANYRSVVTVAIAGNALAVQMMGGKELWNHDAFIDYADRHMQLTVLGGDWYGKIGRFDDAFTANMWAAYRANYGPIWPNNETSEGGGNTAPVLNTISAKTVIAGQKLEFVVVATDADNDTLTYSTSALPVGSLFNITTKTFTWTPGSAQTGVFAVTFSVSDGKGGTATTTVTVTVNPLPVYSLSISATDGSVTKRINGVVTTATSFAQGTVVQLTAAANTGYAFISWSGSASGTANPVAITMDTNKAVTANCTANTYTLNITAANGIVTKSPNKVTYTYGETVTLTATANTGYTFIGWSDSTTGTANTVTLTMDSNKSITANFTQNAYTLNITAANGTVTKSPDKAAYTYGETVTLTATANTGYTFDSWSGSATGTTNPVTITMNANKAIMTNYAPNNMPVAHWLFDQPYQSTAVDIINEETATLINDPNWGEAWAREHLIRLDSGSQAMQIPMISCHPESGSIALRIQPENTDSMQILFGHALDSMDNRIALYLAAGNLALGIGDTLQSNICLLTTNQSYHVAVTWDDTAYAVFVDGGQKTSGVFNGLSRLDATADVGNYGTPENRTSGIGFRGLVEDVQLYSYALTEEAIQTLSLTHYVRENRTLEFIVGGFDAQGNPVSYTAQNLPQGAAFDATSQIFSWQPVLYRSAGQYQITFTATGQPDHIVTVSVLDATLPGWYSSFLKSVGKD